MAGGIDAASHASADDSQDGSGGGSREDKSSQTSNDQHLLRTGAQKVRFPTIKLAPAAAGSER